VSYFEDGPLLRNSLAEAQSAQSGEFISGPSASLREPNLGKSPLPKRPKPVSIPAKPEQFSWKSATDQELIGGR